MIVAWQGWQIEVPDDWSPVKIEGNAQAGYLLMADLDRPRLGIRWKEQKGKKFDAHSAAAALMKEEVGELEAKKAKPHPLGEWVAPLLYEDNEPPGRDLWVAYSKTTSRLFQVVYHAQHRDRVLRDKLLPTLVDGSLDEELRWSVFELSCRTPAGMHLEKHRLNAGDLSLSFEGAGRKVATIRQIAPARLALSRWPMARWIAEQASWRGREYKVVGTPDAASEVQRQKVIRRRRFFWMFWLPKGFTVLARHDQAKNRLVLVDASEEKLASEIMQSAGWARLALEQSAEPN